MSCGLIGPAPQGELILLNPLLSSALKSLDNTIQAKPERLGGCTIS
jgi:hypothetical protein